MIVVSDTTPLISLMKASRLELLATLFHEVLIPEAVFSELTANPRFQAEADQIRKAPYIKVVSVSEQKAVDVLRRSSGLDLGESEAIVFADDQKADVLLMDEAKGRKVAKAMGLYIMGTVGVLLFAFEKNALTDSEVKEALEQLQQADRRIGDELIQYALRKLSK
jgi:predicted nucleic acid-binding protein